MLYVGLGLLFLLFCFSFVLLFGAPYLPTLSKQATLAIELADLKSGETMLELGCGDGKVLLAAAKADYKAVGYELNPILFLVCKLRTWRYRKQVKVYCRNFWTAPWPPAEAVFVFVMRRHMPQLNVKLEAYPHKPIKLISFAFAVPDKRPIKSQDGVYVYQY